MRTADFTVKKEQEITQLLIDDELATGFVVRHVDEQMEIDSKYLFCEVDLTLGTAKALDVSKGRDDSEDIRAVKWNRNGVLHTTISKRWSHPYNSLFGEYFMEEQQNDSK